MIHDEDALKLDPGADLFENRKEHVVHDQEAVFGVVDDAGEFVRVQSHIEGVQNGSHCRNPEI